jgi:hypothetical protein
VTLAQASIAAILLIILPLTFQRRDGGNKQVKRSKIITYILAIGLAFLFIEIAFIQNSH